MLLIGRCLPNRKGKKEERQGETERQRRAHAHIHTDRQSFGGHVQILNGSGCESINVNVTAWTVDVAIHSADDSQSVIYE